MGGFFDFDELEAADAQQEGDRRPSQPGRPGELPPKELDGCGGVGNGGEQDVRPAPAGDELRFVRGFYEALEVFSAVRASTDPGVFCGVDWSLVSEVGEPVGDVHQGVWQDVQGELEGPLLLHGLPAGTEVAFRARYADDSLCGADSIPGYWVRGCTLPLPARGRIGEVVVPDREEHRLEGVGSLRRGGAVPGVCAGWASNGAQSFFSAKDRCLRCGDLYCNHCMTEASGVSKHPVFRTSAGEDYIIMGVPAIAVFNEPRLTARQLCAYGLGETIRVFEWDRSQTWRRCRRKPRGSGGDGGDSSYGWVKIRTRTYGTIAVPADERAEVWRDIVDTSRLDDQVCERLESERLRKERDRASILAGACVVTRRADRLGLDVSDGRLLLGSNSGGVAIEECFRTALVFGAHHTCTTALVLELEAQFEVRVLNHYDGVDPAKRPENHKHRILRSPPHPEDALAVCIVKEPCFWLQSLTRHGATYAIRPIQRDHRALTGWADRTSYGRHGTIADATQEQMLDLILGPAEFFGDIYEDGALGVWEATVRSYFDEAVFPRRRSVVLRSEDFLFDFAGVVAALERAGLQRREGAPPPSREPAKGGIQHPHTRGREEALRWYGNPSHRHVGLEPRHIERVTQALGEPLLAALGYSEACAVASWASGGGLAAFAARAAASSAAAAAAPPGPLTSEDGEVPRGAWPADRTPPFSLMLVGSWSGFSPEPMAWQGGAFVATTEVGDAGTEHFQLLIDGRWDQTLYPSLPDSSCYERGWRVRGPDGAGHGMNWEIGKRGLEHAAPGVRCRLSVRLDDRGDVCSITWGLF